MPSKKLVVIPTYNEEENIGKLIEALFALSVDDLSVLVVDDGNDNTPAIIGDLKRKYDRLNIIKRDKKSGRGNAVLAGFMKGLESDYDVFVEIDADFSHDPKELPRILSLLQPGSVVIGSRYLKESKIINWPLRRRIFSKLANIYASLILQVGIIDYTNGYRAYDRSTVELLKNIEIKSSGYIVLSELAYKLHKLGVKFFETPTIFVNRSRGASSFSFKEIKEAFLAVVEIRLGLK
jgi:dolichol-phosphate mannosyltransferase